MVVGSDYPPVSTAPLELAEYVDLKAGDGSGLHQPLTGCDKRIEVDVPVLSMASNADRVAPLSGCKTLR